LRSPPADALTRTAEKGPVKLSVHVWPRTPRLSDLVEMDVRVESQANVDVKPPAFGQAVGDFLVRDYSERPASVAGASKVLSFHYQLEPAHAGKHLIRSVSLEFVDKRPRSEGSGAPTLIETEPLEINVTSEFSTGAPSLANLEPMAPPQPVSAGSASQWLIGFGVVALIGLAAVFLRRRKRRVVEPRRLTPEEIAHAALAQLLAENLPARGLIKEFYLRLTGIVRQYVEDTTGIRAPEQTTEEFLRDMRSRAVFPSERSDRLAEFLEAADLVKYAGQQPEMGQIDQATARAREFVNLAPSAAAPAHAGAG
jgi:LPXTG-motif cell wall-anchored protein